MPPDPVELVTAIELAAWVTTMDWVAVAVV